MPTVYPTSRLAFGENAYHNPRVLFFSKQHIHAPNRSCVGCFLFAVPNGFLRVRTTIIVLQESDSQGGIAAHAYNYRNIVLFT